MIYFERFSTHSTDYFSTKIIKITGGGKRMLRYSSENISPGMVVGRSILDPNGRVLLTAGQLLNERYVHRIKELNIPLVYIDEQMGVEDPAPLVNPETIAKATSNLKRSYEQCAKTGKTDLKSIQSQIDNIIDDLVHNNNIMIGMSDLKNYDDYTYQHSVNVCVLAIILGISRGYNRLQLQTLGTGAIMHDIGKINIPLEILNKPAALTYEEFIFIKKHPWEGFNIINSSDLDLASAAQVVLQHHERIDGNGYPRGISQDKIHEYGLIVAVADVFDALVSDRPYRRGFNNKEAIEIVEQNRGTHLSPIFVDILKSHLNLYPPGTVVTLSTGDIAIVTQENIKESKSPQVKLLFNSEQQPYELERLLILESDKTVFITKALSPADADLIVNNYLFLNKKDLSTS